MSDEPRCSFCDKTRHEVKKIISGPKVFICDECIHLCNDIVGEDGLGDDDVGLFTATRVHRSPSLDARLLETFIDEKVRIKEDPFAIYTVGQFVDAYLVACAEASGTPAHAPRHYEPVGELMNFTRFFALHLHAGVPLVESLGNLALSPEIGFLVGTIQAIKTRVGGGDTLSDALAHHTGSFDDLWIAMARAGETAGTLDKTMTALADFMDFENALLRKTDGISSIKRAELLFTYTMGMLLTAGVSLLPSLDVTATVLPQDGDWRRAARSIRKHMATDGASLANAMEITGVFPVTLMVMVKTGEASGTLPAVLTKLAEYYRNTYGI